MDPGFARNVALLRGVLEEQLLAAPARSVRSGGPLTGAEICAVLEQV